MYPFFATPMYGGVCNASYLLAMRDLWLAMCREGVPNILFIPEDSLVARARNECVYTFRDLREKGKELTHLFFVDSDIGGFSPDDVSVMLGTDLPIIVGAYPIKNPKPPVTFCLNATQPPQVKRDPEGRHFVRVRNAGTGFMCIQAKVLDALVDACPDRRYWTDAQTTKYDLFGTGLDPSPVNPGKPEYLSEDYFFCALAEKQGFGTWAYYECSDLSHTGKFVFQGSFKQHLQGGIK